MANQFCCNQKRRERVFKFSIPSPFLYIFAKSFYITLFVFLLQVLQLQTFKIFEISQFWLEKKEKVFAHILRANLNLVFIIQIYFIFVIYIYIVPQTFYPNIFIYNKHHLYCTCYILALYSAIPLQICVLLTINYFFNNKIRLNSIN